MFDRGRLLAGSLAAGVALAVGVAPADANFILIDDFQDSAFVHGASIEGVNGWTTHRGSQNVAPVAASADHTASRLDDPSDAANMVFRLRNTGQTGSPIVNVFKSLPGDGVPLGQTGTLFGRMLVTNATDVSATFGLSSFAAPTGFSRHQPYLSAGPDTANAGKWQVNAFDGAANGNAGASVFGLATNLEVNQWYNFWVVATVGEESWPGDYGSYDLYMTTGLDSASSGDRIATQLKFRAAPDLVTPASLVSVIMLAGGSTTLDRPAVLYDSIYFSEGQNLANAAVPEPGALALAAIAGGAFLLRRSRALCAKPRALGAG